MLCIVTDPEHTLFCRFPIFGVHVDPRSHGFGPGWNVSHHLHEVRVLGSGQTMGEEQPSDLELKQQGSGGGGGGDGVL